MGEQIGSEDLVEMIKTVGYKSNIMKKLVLSIVVAAFAVAVQAGDAACADKAASAGCCAAKQAAVQANNAECPMAKQAKIAKAKADKNSKQAAIKKPLKSPKAVTETRG